MKLMMRLMKLFGVAVVDGVEGGMHVDVDGVDVADC